MAFRTFSMPCNRPFMVKLSKSIHAHEKSGRGKVRDEDEDRG